MTQVTINLYSFSELNEKAKAEAIIEHSAFLLSVAENDEEYNSSLEDNYVIENIEINDYVFFEDGELAHCTTYTPTGETTFHFHGRDYKI